MMRNQKQIKTNSGFILVATLVILAGIALASQYFYAWTQDAIKRSELLKQKVNAQIDLSDTKEVALFWLMTQPISEPGMEIVNLGDSGKIMDNNLPNTYNNRYYIKLYGTPYTYKDTEITLQDAQGLVNLNDITEDNLRNLLKIFQISEEDTPGLSDKYFDYVEKEKETTRLNGASKETYTENKMPPPTNVPLRTPLEAKRILDWNLHDAFWKEKTGLHTAVTTTEPKQNQIQSKNTPNKPPKKNDDEESDKDKQDKDDKDTAQQSSSEKSKKNYAPININTTSKAIMTNFLEIPEDVSAQIIESRNEDKYFISSINEIVQLTGDAIKSINKEAYTFKPGEAFALTIKHKKHPSGIRIEIAKKDAVKPWEINYFLPVHSEITKKTTEEQNQDESDEAPKIPNFPDPTLLSPAE